MTVSLTLFELSEMPDKTAVVPKFWLSTDLHKIMNHRRIIFSITYRTLRLSIITSLC